MQSEQSPSFLQDIFDFFWSPFRTIKSFYRDLSDVDVRLRDDSIGVRVLAMIATPFRLMGGFISMMVQNWPTSRSGVAAIASLPAILTLLGLLGAWVLNDYIRNESWRVNANQGYYEFNVATHADTPESALAFARKLVEIDPDDDDLKFQLGVAEMTAGNSFAADDVMASIAPDVPVTQSDQAKPDDPENADDLENPDDPDENQGMMKAHIWRAGFLVMDKTAAEFKEVIGQAERHLEMAIAADSENLDGKSRLANLYMRYASLLEEQSPERLEYLIKADETFREIIEGEALTQKANATQIVSLGPSILVRKQLEAIDPENFSIDDDVDNVLRDVTLFLNRAKRYKNQQIQLWLVLLNTASQVRQFDFAVAIADEGLKIVEDPEARKVLAQAKSETLRKAALSINNFDEFESYRDRFVYLCEAARAYPKDPVNYKLLLQFVGRENPKPTIQVARALGLASPGEAVPIKPEWLYRICVDARLTGLATSLIGIEEFHLGNNEAAIKNWSVAQQFDIATREFVAQLLEVTLIGKQDKLDNLDTILSEAVLIYPEFLKIRMIRGIHKMREKDYEAAIDDFRIVLENNPNDLPLRKRLKYCYLYMGKRQAAADEQKIIDNKILNFPEPYRTNALKLLKRMDEAESTAQ